MAATKITSDTIFEQLENVRHLFHSREGRRGGGNNSELSPSSYYKYNLEDEKRKLFSWIENLDCPCVKSEINHCVREFKEDDTILPSRLSDGMYNFLEMIALKEYFLNPKNVFEFISGMTNESYNFGQCLEKNRSHEIEIDSASCLICDSCNTVTCLQCFETVNNEVEEEVEEEKEKEEERNQKASSEIIEDFCTSSRASVRLLFLLIQINLNLEDTEESAVMVVGCKCSTKKVKIYIFNSLKRVALVGLYPKRTVLFLRHWLLNIEILNRIKNMHIIYYYFIFF
nr:MAG: hypothetical protein [Porcellio scaber clopovirus]